MIDFAAVSRHSPIGRVLRLPLRAIPRGLVVPVLQGELAGSLWLPQASVPGCWLGYYEHAKQRLFSNTVRRGDVVFDIGANAGFYTLLAAARCGAEGKVIAFEPLPRNLQFLKRHLQLNRVTNTTIIEAAVADFTGFASFDVADGHACEGRLATSGALGVQVVSLAQAVAAGEIPQPDVLKIDVEGGELAVLEGAMPLLTSRRLRIFLATHGAAVHRSCCELLTDCGYTLQPIGDAGTSIDTTDELFAS